MTKTNVATASMLELDSKNEKYLAQIFCLLKNRDGMVMVDKKTNFNYTELRMLSEIISAKYEGKRLISTQLAKLLGVTRSAVSQIVNRLEGRGIVKRVADDVDRKIAYVEISSDISQMYGEDIRCMLAFVGSLVAEFGEDNFNKMCQLFEKFSNLAQKKLKKAMDERKKKNKKE